MVIGRERTRRPVAWKTALAMAAAMPTRPISPIPLTPIGLKSCRGDHGRCPAVRAACCPASRPGPLMSSRPASSPTTCQRGYGDSRWQHSGAAIAIDGSVAPYRLPGEPRVRRLGPRYDCGDCSDRSEPHEGQGPTFNRLQGSALDAPQPLSVTAGVLTRHRRCRHARSCGAAVALPEGRRRG